MVTYDEQSLTTNQIVMEIHAESYDGSTLAVKKFIEPS